MSGIEDRGTSCWCCGKILTEKCVHKKIKVGRAEKFICGECRDRWEETSKVKREDKDDRVGI